MKKTPSFLFRIFIMSLALFALLTSPLISAEGGFNLKVEIPPEYQKILPGEDIFATLSLFNLDNELRKDTTIEYWIIGPTGEIGRRQETIAIETQASLVRSLTLPEDAPEGDYSLQARVLYDEGREQLASGSFVVHKEAAWIERIEDKLLKNKILFGLGGMIILLLIILRASWDRLKKISKNWRLKRKIARIVARRQNK